MRAAPTVIVGADDPPPQPARARRDERDSLQQVLVPTPIGPGPEYHPRPAMHAPCAPATSTARRMHLELFANGFAVIVPARIGIRSPRCRAHVWTRDPTGVVELDAPATLGRLFAIWGQPLGRRRLLGFHGAVSLFRNGVRVRGDPSLARRSATVTRWCVEIGGYVPPHRSYRFVPH